VPIAKFDTGCAQKNLRRASKNYKRMEKSDNCMILNLILYCRNDDHGIKACRRFLTPPS